MYISVFTHKIFGCSPVILEKKKPRFFDIIERIVCAVPFLGDSRYSTINDVPIAYAYWLLQLDLNLQWFLPEEAFAALEKRKKKLSWWKPVKLKKKKKKKVLNAL